MPTIAVGLAPPAIVAAAKLVTTVWPSPVTAGPAAAAGIAVPPRSLPRGRQRAVGRGKHRNDRGDDGGRENRAAGFDELERDLDHPHLVAVDGGRGRPDRHLHGADRRVDQQPRTLRLHRVVEQELHDRRQVADQVAGKRVHPQRAAHILGPAAIDVGVFVDRLPPALLGLRGDHLERHPAEARRLQQAHEARDAGRGRKAGDARKAAHSFSSTDRRPSACCARSSAATC